MAKLLSDIGMRSKKCGRYTNLKVKAQDIFRSCNNNEVFAETECISDTYKALGAYRGLEEMRGAKGSSR
ncbi:hypothetical protein ACLVWU_06575 [Bdellovibrio sp. HCB290]|uniref:hypothetical protein n=1 Tax=Bdellovibrio sp. HCB290 TaxID=3394356 RepID=UPI0039B42971